MMVFLLALLRTFCPSIGLDGAQLSFSQSLQRADGRGGEAIRTLADGEVFAKQSIFRYTLIIKISVGHKKVPNDNLWPGIRIRRALPCDAEQI